MRRVRTRFAPSPTGPLHIGGVRTALYCYLFAKKHNGDFLLRIEDTDKSRLVAGAEEYIENSLKWCGIIADESPTKGGKYAPYRQSERKDLYRKYVMQLVENGWAYYAFDTEEELDALRVEYEAKKQVFTYNCITRDFLNNSLNISKDKLADKLSSGSFVIRFKIPKGREIVIRDLIRGEVRYNSEVLDDKVLFKSDGMPTYHLANVVDDHLMEISHVIRGEEWLPSTPLHILLYEAFGWEMPEFCHLPLILKPEGKGKLSKRDGDKHGFPVFPINWEDKQSGEIYAGYKEQGYYPEAFVNILALLGWHGASDKEIYSMEELIEEFSIERVNKSPAKFDPDKTKWFNQQYLRSKTKDVLFEELSKVLRENGVSTILTKDKGEAIVELLKDRVNFTRKMYEDNKYLFHPPTQYNQEELKKVFTEDIKGAFPNILNIIETSDMQTAKDNLSRYAMENSLNIGKIMKSIRILIVGDIKGPDIFDIMRVLGKEESIKRLNAFTK